MSKAKKITVCGLFIAVGCILPSFFHMFGLGTAFSPLHFPALLCGLVCGPWYGLACGVLNPILCSLLTGMPPVARLGYMIPEIACYGFFAGLFFFSMKKKSTGCRAQAGSTERMDSADHTGSTECTASTERTGSTERIASTEHTVSTGCTASTERMDSADHTGSTGCTGSTEHTAGTASTEHTVSTGCTASTEHTASTGLTASTEHTASTGCTASAGSENRPAEESRTGDRLMLRLYLSLIAALLVGKLVGGVFRAVMFTGGTYTVKLWATTFFVESLPGIAVQLLTIPLVYMALKKAKLI